MAMALVPDAWNRVAIGTTSPLTTQASAFSALAGERHENLLYHANSSEAITLVENVFVIAKV